VAIFKGLIEKAKDKYDLERPSPPPPIPNGIQRPIDPPTEAQVRASIEAEMAQARQQAVQYGMPQRYVDKIFSRDQYTPPPSPPSLPPVMTDTVPEEFRPPPPDPRIPPTIISDPREEMGGPGPGRFGGRSDIYPGSFGRSDIYNPTPPKTRTLDSNLQLLGNAMPMQLPQGPVTGGQGFLDSEANRRALQLLQGPFFADYDYGPIKQPPSFFQAPIMQQQYAMQGIGSLPDPEGYTGVRAMAEGGALFDPANYTDARPMAGDPFRGVPTKIVSGPFGDIEVPVTYEGDTYGGTGSEFDQIGNVSGIGPYPGFIPEDPYGNNPSVNNQNIPSIFGPGDTTTTTTTTTTDTTDTDTDTTDTTDTTGTPTPSIFGPGGFQPQTPTYPLPASEIYPNVITPVEREAVFPSYDDPITVNNPFEKPPRDPINYGYGIENAPPGFERGDGPVTMALVDYINPSTGDRWTASDGGVTKMPPGWEVFDPEKEYAPPAPSVPPINTIQAPPPSPFSPVTPVPPPPLPPAEPPFYAKPLPVLPDDDYGRGNVGKLPPPVFNQGGPVPFQQGIGSFVR
jgi:hypothetical protein